MAMGVMEPKSGMARYFGALVLNVDESGFLYFSISVIVGGRRLLHSPVVPVQTDGFAEITGPEETTGDGSNGGHAAQRREARQQAAQQSQPVGLQPTAHPPGIDGDKPHPN